MNFVLDTNILISLTLWDQSVAHRLFSKIVILGHELFSSKEIIDEYRHSLTRDFDYSNEEINSFIERTLLFLNLVETNEKLDIVKEDQTDNKILECAIAANADYVITYDKHLLRLKEFKSIRIITPEEALRLLK